MALDGTCRVGLFTQAMNADRARKRAATTASFLDGAKGKGIDIVSGNVQGKPRGARPHGTSCNGAMLARLADADTMNVTISVKVEASWFPVIGMSLKRIDDHETGAVAERLTRN